MIASWVLVLFVVVFLHRIYFHLLVWKKPTRLSLSLFGLEDNNKDHQLEFQSHLSLDEATKSVNDLLKRTERIKPSLATSAGFKKDKFTIVMPSYKRTRTLREIFDHYCGMDDIIDQLLIVWNNIDEIVPQALEKHKCKFPIKFLEQKRNTLNNRFVLYPEIQTECEPYI